jgi:hypothetical protein
MSIRLSKARSLPSDQGRAKNDTDATTGAKSAEPAVGRIVNDGLLFMAGSLTDEQLSSGDAAAIMRSLPWAEFSYRMDGIHEPLETVIRKSALSEQKTLRLRKDTPTATATASGISGSMNVIDPMAVAYANQQSGGLIVEISTKMRASIQQMITAAASGEISSYDVAKMLRSVIPLHTAWATAVQNTYTNTMRDALLDDTIDMATARSRAVNAAAAHSKRLTIARSWNIARTETMTAANNGKFAGWSDAVDKGWMVPDSLKIWEEGRDPCPQCAPLVGEIRRWDEPFSNGKQMPPEHPSCRCTADTLPPDQKYLDRMAEQRAREQTIAGALATDSKTALYVPATVDPVDLTATKTRELLNQTMLDLTDRSGVGGYTGLGARNLNAALRAGLPADAYSGSMSALDSALAESSLPEDMMLYRTVPPSAFPDNVESLVGTVLSDKGYLSTSARSGGYAEGSNRDVSIRIAAPKGTPALWMRPVSSVKSEDEVLLGRNLPLVVTNVRAIPEFWGTRYVVDATVGVRQ